MLKELSKTVLANTLWTMVGRSNLVRLGRFLLNEGRLDCGNALTRNGERLIQSAVAEHFQNEPRVVALDIGANVGHWSCGLAQQLRRYSDEFQIFAFEPCSETASSLRANLADWQLADYVQPVELAVSSNVGEVKFYSLGANEGRNGLYPHQGETDQEQVVACTTLDSWREEMNIDRIHYLKCDAEGHDLEVLRGGRELLAEQRIDMLQFEYNHRWIESSCFLRNAFDFLNGYGYQVGKITRLGVEFYHEWDFELESFCEGNYFATTEDHLPAMPSIPYWKAA